MSKRKQHSPELKAKVALEALKGEQTVPEPGLGGRHHVSTLSRQICHASRLPAMVAALNQAILGFGPPEIMNTDQGSQFTSFAWTDGLRRSGVPVSMDGKGRLLPSRDNPSDAPEALVVFAGHDQPTWDLPFEYP